MKIVLLGNTGLSIYIFRMELLERLLSMGHEVHVVTPADDYLEIMSKMGCQCHTINIDRHGTNPFKDALVIFNYKRIFEKIRPDIVFSYTIKPNIYGSIACRLLKIPIVVNITGLGTAVEHKGWKQLIALLLYRFSLKNVRTIFFQNQDNMNFFIKNDLFPEKHKLLPGSGVNLTRFTYKEYPSDDTINFVFISRLMKEKGIDQYLEAAEYITKKYPNTRFHICGFCEKEYEVKLEALKNNSAIIYHGMVKDVNSILPQMHCTVHPTYYPEGLSNVLLESLAVGRPIITTDRAGCREIVEDGVNGFVVIQRDSEDLINKIERFLSLSNATREEMGKAGRAKVEREFDRNIVVSQYIEIVKQSQQMSS